MRHDDFSGMYAVGAMAVRNIGRGLFYYRESAQDGDAFAVFIEAQMRPIGIKMIRLIKTLVNYFGRIAIPVALPVIPKLGDFLKTDDIYIQLVNRFLQRYTWNLRSFPGDMALDPISP